MLQEMRHLPDYTFNVSQRKFIFNKKFEFPSEEEDLIKHIKDFKEKLDKAIKSVPHPIP